MTDNFLRQICYSIEQEYWKRYMDNYNQYGESSLTTKKRWEEWQVADNITKQLIDSLTATRSEADDKLYECLESKIDEIQVENIVKRIKKDSLRKWCDSWRKNAMQIVAKMQMKRNEVEEGDNGNALVS